MLSKLSKSGVPWWLIVLVALGMRLMYQQQTTGSPLFRTFQVDPQWHAEWAEQIVAGQWSEGRPFFRAPLYPFFLAAIRAVSNADFVTARIVQHLLGALSCGLIYSLARKLFDSSVALLAGLMAAGYGPFIYQENELSLPTLEIFLFLLSLLAVWRAAERGSMVWWSLAGLFTGLTCITRPNFLLVIPVVILWGWVGFGFEQWNPFGSAWRKKTALAAAYGFGAVAAILPVTLHNRLMGGEWVLIASQGGVNFFIGNNPQADGRTALAPGAYYPSEAHYVDSVWANSRVMAEQDTGRKMSEKELSDYWYDRAWDYWRAEPWAAFRLTLIKGYYLLNGFEIESERSVYLDALWSPLAKMLIYEGWIAFPGGVVIPLAIVGLFGLVPRSRGWWLLVGCGLAYSASVVAFFVTARHRLPLFPLLIIFAAAMLHRIISMVSQRQWRVLLWPGFGLVLALYLCNTRWFDVRQIDLARQLRVVAYAHLRLGEFAEAVPFYQQALELAPQDFEANYNLGFVLHGLGREAEALLRLQNAHRLLPENVNTLNLLGNVLVALNRPAQAEPLYQQAVTLQPDFPLAYGSWGELLLQQQRFDEALPLLHRAVELRPENGQYWYRLAVTQWRCGAISEAKKSLVKARSLGAQVDDELARALGADEGRSQP
ncbi:MAG: hypothetical protein HJJLKODD_02955 [Phycisphaerae bacterium]|nr:hypothetical protein [Phycisphaerae bacterium]